MFRKAITIAAALISSALALPPQGALAFDVAVLSSSLPTVQSPTSRAPVDRTMPGLDANGGAFGSTIIPVGTIAALSQWTSAARINAESDCGGTTCATPTGAQFVSAVAAARHLSALKAMLVINSSVNRAVTYRGDQNDHWASVTETVASGQGDCEDYAIAKRALLIKAGFDAQSLQFVVLNDTRRGLQHAVLVVHLEDARYVLDNLSDVVARDAAYSSYRPIASIIGDREFLHGFARAPAVRTAENALPATMLRPAFEVDARWLSL